VLTFRDRILRQISPFPEQIPGIRFAAWWMFLARLNQIASAGPNQTDEMVNDCIVMSKTVNNM
jgi:hypothetical protein